MAGSRMDIGFQGDEGRKKLADYRLRFPMIRHHCRVA